MNKTICELILEEFASKSKIRVITGEAAQERIFNRTGFLSACCGLYTPDQESLTFYVEGESDRALDVLLHEIGHASGIRLGRPMQCFPEVEYNKEEVIAESTAQHILIELGLMLPYINHLMNKYIVKYSRCLSDAQIEETKVEARKAADYILENWLSDFARSCTKKAV